MIIGVIISLKLYPPPPPNTSYVFPTIADIVSCRICHGKILDHNKNCNSDTDFKHALSCWDGLSINGLVVDNVRLYLMSSSLA